MASRLDRLFILLDTGSSDSIRFSAARQLGQVQRVQPNDLNYLLHRIKEYSSKSVWETRVAAGQAIGCVLEQVSRWPPGTINQNDDKKKVLLHQTASQLINGHQRMEEILDNFDLHKILSLLPIMSSIDATELDEQDPTSSTSSKGKGRRNSKVSSKKVDKEQLLRQRKLINKELGIAMVDSLNLGVKSTDIVSNDDLQDHEASKLIKNPENPKEARYKLQQLISNYEKTIEALHQANCIENQPKVDVPSDLDTPPNENSWPLSDITRQYSDSLFDPSWEVRHGAAIALREIVKAQGKCAGKRRDLPHDLNDQLNQIWLIDMALKSICVLALDKFGDFLFDQVVAPVRENAAQLLGCCVAAMTEKNAHKVIRIVLGMLTNPGWEIRHGGIVGLKYSLSVINETLRRELLIGCFNPMFELLGDSVDDVSAEAAAALVPVKDLIIESIPGRAPQLIKFLWEHLSDLDELTTSTSNIVLLLASLITCSSTKLDPTELTKSLPRLWPLLSHTSTTVRVSVLKALITLIKTQESTCLSWMPDHLISTAIRLVFQRCILENKDEVRPYIEEVWMLLLRVDQDQEKAKTEIFNLLRLTSQYLNYWLCLVMQPFTLPIDRSSPMWLSIRSDGTINNDKPDGEVFIGSSTFNADTLNQQKCQVNKCRITGTKMIGSLYAILVSSQSEFQHANETLKYLSEMFIHYLKTKSANQRMYSGWALESWAHHQLLLNSDIDQLRDCLPSNLSNQLEAAIKETNLYYDELASNFTRLQQETREFMTSLKEANISVQNFPTSIDRRTIYNLHQIQSLATIDLMAELTRISSKKTHNGVSLKDHNTVDSSVFASLDTKKRSLAKLLASTNSSQRDLTRSVMSSLACAMVSWHFKPERLNLVIDPLLDSIAMEEDPVLLDKSVFYVTRLCDILCRNDDKQSDRVDGIIVHLVETLRKKRFSNINENLETTNEDAESETNNGRIISLDNLQRQADQSRNSMRRQSSVSSTGSTLKRSLSLTSSHEMDSDLLDEKPSNQSLQLDSETLGLKLALNSLTKHFGRDLPSQMTKFWSKITSEIHININNQSGPCNHESLVENLLLLSTVGGSVHHDLQSKLLELFKPLTELLSSASPILRHLTSQCLGVISKLSFNDTIMMINQIILPMLDQVNCYTRCGSIETISSIIEHLQLELVPHIDMFVVHVLRRMSDQNDQVRLMATHCFGKLLSFMPLNCEKAKDESKSVLEPTSGCVNLGAKREEHKFIEQLLDYKKLENFSVPFEMNAELRSYQQDGLNWLSFLNRYNLHGILCDEMGLGKTFMTICMVASDHYLSKSCDTGKGGQCPSLIVCPSTLIEHWLYEIIKFVPEKTRSVLNPISYSGGMVDRVQVRNRILSAINEGSGCGKTSINLVVSSYDMVRNDIDFFKTVDWNYCVLDEGHMIKNIKTKLSKAIRMIRARHRLILSGTPIQNNVSELWSLFDFLMPGFLGSERQFYHKFSKPILQSREPKCTSREQEAGALAMESLHRQVLPFILRRLKEDVLNDLPPKIIQDYYCELSPLQQRLYEDFTRSKLCKDVTRKSLGNLVNQDQDRQAAETSANSRSHVFQALQYLKNVCNHPKLVLTQKHSEYAAIKKNLDAEKSSLDDINHSSKLRALKQLLVDCGIGIQNQLSASPTDNQSMPIEESVVNQHRALVFCQVKSMVNIIENDLLKKHLPDVTYLKLDGSVAPNQRHSIVSRFNDDPSIDILLLTTQVGGLGLNLTGADTVIFVEHDWNPTKDLQAMDRAHRIGQRKVVNVYRLITKATLEEKIMGLQKFKTMVSNTVINQNNAALGTMNLDQLFDLFSCAPNTSSGAEMGPGEGRSVGRKSSIEDLLPELWEQQQYETEYDLTSFVSSLKG